MLTIDDPSGRLIRWRLRLAEFDFEVKYKKGKANTQADALSRLHTSAETKPHDDNDDIPVFMNELDKNESIDQIDTDFIDLQYAKVDSELACNMEENEQFDPIKREEILQEQLHDKFCASIRRTLNEGE